jgi:hypothetical protein
VDLFAQGFERLTRWQCLNGAQAVAGIALQAGAQENGLTSRKLNLGVHVSLLACGLVGTHRADIQGDGAGSQAQNSVSTGHQGRVVSAIDIDAGHAGGVCRTLWTKHDQAGLAVHDTL